MSDDAAAVQAYGAIVERDGQLVTDDLYKLFDPCALAPVGDQRCEATIIELKSAAHAMLADLKGARVPSSIATADGEYRNGIQTVITMAGDFLDYVATGSIAAHDRAVGGANTAERQLNQADADLAHEMLTGV